MKRRKRSKWGQRWTNRKPDGTFVTRGDNWTASRSQTCPHCGRRYYWFRMPFDRSEVLRQLNAESDKGEIPCVTLRTLLGRCHEIKMRAWEAHIELCAGVDVETDARGRPCAADLRHLEELEAVTGRFVTRDRRKKKRRKPRNSGKG